MGFLEVGEPPLSFEESKALAEYIREHGSIQFVQLFNGHKDHHTPALRWGEEMEYHAVQLDEEHHKAKVFLRAIDVINALNAAEELTNGSLIWHVEYGAWMIESVPKFPYNHYIQDLLTVEPKMVLRRMKMKTILQAINPSLSPLSIPCFPLLGVGDDYFCPKEGPDFLNNASQSLYLDDRVICPHPRFPTLTKGIVTRRGKPVNIKIPLFQDENTNPQDEPYPGFIHMDACGFGMGMCCLQVTLNATSLFEARSLYDQLAPLTPVMLALSACTPFFKGKLANTDTRWEVLCQAMDDRTDEEKNIGWRSRYGGVSRYISTCAKLKPEYNDINVPYHAPTYDYLISQGIDEILAKHIAVIMIRDPLVIFPDKVYVDDSTTTMHFENLQSTNWNSLRFKPPPAMDSDVCWRVEFRPMDVQITDFENAAYSIFLVLLSRMIVALKLNFLIPMSQVDENLQRASIKDAILSQKFWFRLNVIGADCKERQFFMPSTKNTEDRIEELTMREIFLGTPEFEGLLGLLEIYLKEVVKCPEDDYNQLKKYLDLLKRRVIGETPTGAAYLRNFIVNHPDYAKDSIINGNIAFDLVKMCAEARGDWLLPKMNGIV